MLLFIKGVDGKLQEATLPQILDSKTVLFNKDGENVDRPGEDNTLSDMSKISDVVDVLSKKIEGIETSSTDDGILKSENENLRAKLDAYKKNAAKGFPILDDEERASIKITDDKEVWDFIGSKYNISLQGKELMDKRVHPFHQLEDKIIKTPDGRVEYNPRDEFVKYFSLIGIASQKNPTPAKLEAMRLLDKVYGDLSTEVKTAIGDSGNAFPIPDIVEAEILAFAREQSIILQYARSWNMVSEKQSFPAESAAATVNWGNETEAGDPTITEVELDCEELSSYSTVKNATLADSRSDIVSWIGATLSEAAGQELDNKGFNGLGTDTTFICSGILSAACGYSVVFSSGSTAFSNLTADDLSLMIAALDGLKKQGARFWMNGVMLHYIRTLKTTDDRPVFYDTYGSPTPGMILGFPYTEVLKMPSTSAANTAFLAFGNLRYFAVGRRLDSSALDVDPYGLWTTNRTRYKLYQRWALKMGLANGFVRMLTASS